MKTANPSFAISNIIVIVLAFVAAALVFGVLSGRKLPMISGERAALLVLFVIGFAMCGIGVSRISATGQWLHPLTIIGYLLGALIMVIAAAGYFGFKIGFISDTHTAILSVTVLMTAKLVLGIVHSLI